MNVQGWVTAVRFGPPGQVIVGSDRGAAYRYSLASSIPRIAAAGPDFRFPPTDAPSLRSPDGRFVAAIDERGALRVQELATGRLLWSIADPAVFTFAWSPDSRRIATGSFGWDDLSPSTVQVWDAATGAPASAAIERQSRVAQVFFSPDSRLIAAIAPVDGLGVWEIRTGEPVLHLAGVDSPMLARFEDAAVAVVDPRSRRYTWSLAPDPRPIAELQRIAELVGSRRLASFGGTIRLTARELMDRLAR